MFHGKPRIHCFPLKNNYHEFTNRSTLRSRAAKTLFNYKIPLSGTPTDMLLYRHGRSSDTRLK